MDDGALGQLEHHDVVVREPEPPRRRLAPGRLRAERRPGAEGLAAQEQRRVQRQGQRGQGHGPAGEARAPRETAACRRREHGGIFGGSPGGVKRRGPSPSGDM
ncbi:MAG: hypothetical protein M9894_05100 [Planctomycetes bacterium]|nr:hypothetical protein [Planctomycetota bacterium]